MPRRAQPGKDSAATVTRASSASASSNAFCGSPLSFSLFSLFFDRSIDVRQEAQRRVSRETRLEEEETRKRRAEKADEEENRLTVVNREKNKTIARALCSKFPAINTWFFFLVSVLLQVVLPLPLSLSQRSHISRFWICLCSQHRYSTYEGPAALLSSGRRRARALVARRGGGC